MKVGLIRCLQTEDMCPGTACLKVMKEKKLAFAGITEDIEIIGINTCGGCPGKKAVTRTAEMVKRGADTIALASCIFKVIPIGFLCPYTQEMKDAVVRKLGDTIKIIDYTH
jgi:predicted metal-binding protein